MGCVESKVPETSTSDRKSGSVKTEVKDASVIVDAVDDDVAGPGIVEVTEGKYVHLFSTPRPENEHGKAEITTPDNTVQTPTTDEDRPMYKAVNDSLFKEEQNPGIIETLFATLFGKEKEQVVDSSSPPSTNISYGYGKSESYRALQV
eukprot:46216_1